MGNKNPLSTEKDLRSRIAEFLPIDARIEIELLSRRRDLINDEKHHEILRLLNLYAPGKFVELGPGTNRYAVRLGGYVFKFATDNDGKIDNFKEFKMADRLYPYVAKTYEVSENGTILVAEYVQPFGSFEEMTQLSDQIRSILRKISNQYLIGDVGLTSKNYANWGTRVGTNDPVCLDFAYVYRINSDLFVCRKCSNGSMLIPDPSYVELTCPTCKKTTTFEEIRVRIGNDVHNHEIGDLTDEAYRVTEPVTHVILDKNRSKYLQPNPRKKKKKFYVEEPQEESSIEAEIDDYDRSSNNEMEEREMSKITEMAIAVSREVVRTRNPRVNGVTAVAIQPDDSVDQKPSASEPAHPTIKAVTVHPVVTPPQSKFIEVEARNVEDDDSLDDLKAAFVSSDDGDSEIHDIVDEVVEEEEIPYEFHPAFRRQIQSAINMFVTRVIKSLQEVETYDEIRPFCNRQVYRDEEILYRKLRNRIFNGIARYFNLEKTSNNNGKLHFNMVEEPNGQPYESTMIFIHRLWSNPTFFDSVEQQHVLDGAYAEKYDDHMGIQIDALDSIKVSIASNMSISEEGIDLIVDAIREMWTQPEEEEDDMNIPPEIEHENEPEDESDDDAEDDPVLNAMVHNYVQDAIGSAEEYDEDEESETESDDEDDDETPAQITIKPLDDTGDSLITLSYYNECGHMCIPFYADLDKEDGSAPIASIIDSRNGEYDWMAHTSPDIIFRTKTKSPEYFFQINEHSMEKAVILDACDDGTYIMGIYTFDGLYVEGPNDTLLEVDDSVMMTKINNVICRDMGYNSISSLRHVLKHENALYPEAAIIKNIIEPINEVNAMTSNERPVEYPAVTTGGNHADAEPMSAAEQAAINAMTAEFVDEDEGRPAGVVTLPEPQQAVQEEVPKVETPKVEPEAPPVEPERVPEPLVQEPPVQQGPKEDPQPERQPEPQVTATPVSHTPGRDDDDDFDIPPVKISRSSRTRYD